MRTIVERHGGRLDKLAGAAAMAVFGVPHVREDDALRALRAATEIRDALAAAEPSMGAGSRCRIGVNTGLVLVGGADELAVGDAVSLAARLGEAAAPGEILVGAETLRLVGDAARCEPLEALRLRGVAEPVAAFRVVDLDRLASGAARRLHGPFVGRERELGWLRDAWHRSVQEPGCQLVTLLGAAGVGKSRLVAEVLAGIGQDALALSGRCLPYGDGITFWPLLEALAPVARAADRVLEWLESGSALIAEELFLEIRRLLESLAETGR